MRIGRLSPFLCMAILECCFAHSPNPVSSLTEKTEKRLRIILDPQRYPEKLFLRIKTADEYFSKLPFERLTNSQHAKKKDWLVVSTTTELPSIIKLEIHDSNRVLRTETIQISESETDNSCTILATSDANSSSPNIPKHCDKYK